MPRALVLGATGFIGGHVAMAALGRGWEVRGLRRRPGATGHLGPAPVTWFDGDLEKPATLAAAFDGAEIVFHAAAYYPQNGRNVPAQVQKAVRQVRTVLQAAQRAGVQRLVYTSSLTTIGTVPEAEDRPADERDLYTPGQLSRSAYYECKYAMESEVLRACGEVPAVVVNPTAVFGPGDLHMALGRVLLALARGWGVAWIPAVTNVVDVRDVAQAQVRAAEVGRIGQRYILGGHNLALRELMERAAAILAVRPPQWGIPLGVIDAAVWLGDRLPVLDILGNHLRAVRQWQGYDCAKAADHLGLQTRPLEETLRSAVAWYADNGYLGGRPAVV